MSAEEIYREKQRFIASTERRLRRRMTEIERNLLTLIFERILSRMEVTPTDTIATSERNTRLINELGKIHREFTKPANIKIIAEFAREVMTLPERSRRYFGAISEGMAAKLSEIQRTSEGLLRARMGLTSGKDLQPGGFLQSVIEDVTVRNRLQVILLDAVNQGRDVQGVRTTIRNYLIGEGKDPVGVLTRQADQHLFDTFQMVDRSLDLANAIALGLKGAVYTGGLIETTRPMCCGLNARAWTMEEMEALNRRAEAGNPWSGYKGDVKIHGGGWNCRHGWNWVSNARLLRLRPDLELSPDGKSVRHKIGVPPQGFNAGCSDAQRPPRLAQRKR